MEKEINKENIAAEKAEQPVWQNSTKYLLGVFVAVMFIASGGIFIRESPMPSVTTGLWRMILSLPMMIPFLLMENRNNGGLSALLKIAPKDLILILIGGVGLGLDLVFWYISFDYTSLANANLFGTAVTFTIVPVSYFVFKEKIPKHFFLGALISIIGLVVLLSGKLDPSPDTYLGDFFAFMASVFYAIFLLAVYKSRDRFGSFTILFYATFSCILTMFIAAVIREGLILPTSFSDIIPALGTALCSSIIGQGILGFCLGKVNASLSSLALLSQPAFAAIYGWLFFRENLSWVEIVGMLITLAGVYFAKKSS